MGIYFSYNVSRGNLKIIINNNLINIRLIKDEYYERLDSSPKTNSSFT